ncbi:MAG: CHAD domain-containing protein [Gemmatimonadota bacterium]|nr:CHAD domain-containing protein [Gemmatimonadota bacterium]
MRPAEITRVRGVPNQGRPLDYRLSRVETVDSGIRRIFHEQVDLAISQVHDPELGVAETVHEARRRCKRMRAALRLVRSGFEPDGTFASEDRSLRDLARSLSVSRDAEVQVAAYCRLIDSHGGALALGEFEGIFELLSARRREANDPGVLGELLSGFVQGMEAARGRIGNWPEFEDSFASIRPGLKKTYHRARKGLRRVRGGGASKAFHELRKHAQYHRYHCGLLSDVWPRMMSAREEEVRCLTDALGEANDLSVLRRTLSRSFDPGVPAVDVLLGLAARRTDDLHRQARALGERLFSQGPGPFSRRLGALWALRPGHS